MADLSAEHRTELQRLLDTPAKQERYHLDAEYHAIVYRLAAWNVGAEGTMAEGYSSWWEQRPGVSVPVVVDPHVPDDGVVRFVDDVSPPPP